MTTVTPGLVRHYKLEVAVYTDGTEPTTWSPVVGLRDYNPLKNDKSREDDSDFDSDGRTSEVGTSISSEISGTIKIAEAGVSTVPGHKILSDAGGALGSEGFVHYRETHLTTGEGWTGVADASFNKSGGGQEALTEAEFSLSVRSVEAYTPAP